jgi:hypothetical protein
MKVSLKVVLTFVVNIIAMFAINVIKNADSEYNMGLFLIIIIVGSIAGVITIWSNKSENLEAKTNN